jgi:peptidase A4-like protein
VRRALLFISAVAVSLAIFPAAAGPGAGPSVHPGPIVSLGAMQSSNWAGHSLSYLSNGRKFFTQVSGRWTVPTATQHTSGTAEYSVNWVGIGGGCVDSTCLVVDPTLIQAGTGQYVDAGGQRRYFGWWEVIPGPILEIANFVVRPGDTVSADIRQAGGPILWKITLVNETTGQTFTTSTPYASARLTAEWIEERPSVGGLPAPLPNLSNPRFNDSRANNVAARLSVATEILMDDGTTRLATPSSPDPDNDGFNVCTYSTSCGAPGSP